MLVFLNPLSGFALTKEIADSCYRQGNYQQAISDYKALLRQGVSSDLYYNLGNAYYRSDSLAQAILNYERAYRLSPSDADVKFNLQFARSKTIDKITPESDNFFVALYRDVVTFANVDTWASWSIGSIVVALVLMLCYLFASPLWLRKTGFFGSASFLAVFVFPHCLPGNRNIGFSMVAEPSSCHRPSMSRPLPRTRVPMLSSSTKAREWTSLMMA